MAAPAPSRNSYTDPTPDSYPEHARLGHVSTRTAPISRRYR
jgi:hypothetical protein